MIRVLRIVSAFLGIGLCLVGVVDLLRGNKQDAVVSFVLFLALQAIKAEDARLHND